ncbi:MAG: dihydropteroate synthase [Archaeoglobus sp.]|nr:MAG: dihydropteroate synthase [Archaeoglobus sp.]
MVKFVGVINLSPESFYSGSVCRGVDSARIRAKKMIEEGVDIIDVGGMSTAPYKDTWISEEEELRRVIPVIKELSKLNVPISIDTTRAKVAEKAVEAGASIINAVKPSDEIVYVAKRYGVQIVVVAMEIEWSDSTIISSVVESLRREVERCLKGGISRRKVIVDPAIGFWRKHGRWFVRDACIIANIDKIKAELDMPVMVGISRKSFIGQISGLKNPEDRLVGSVVAEALAVLKGVDYIRTHNVCETRQAVEMAKFIAKFI